MRLRLRYLKLQVLTDNGEYGADLKFKVGLNVIRADNTCGKSTCMKAIIYALGLERMYGPGNHPPLPPAMINLIEEGDLKINVIESNVFLEFENDQSKVVTVHRRVVGADDRDWRLITVSDGPLLSSPGDYASRSMYVRDPGAATREDGFHSYLEKFLGWSMPEVMRFNGDIVPLYLETVLPLFYVEQKFGWSAIQATTPKYFQIREVDKRALEFVLDLEAYRREVLKQRVLQDLDTVEQRWAELVNQCDTVAASETAYVRALPQKPVMTWPLEVAPFLEVLHGTSSISLKQALEQAKSDLSKLENEDIPAAEQVSSEVADKLRELTLALEENEVVLYDVSADIEFDTGELRAIEARLDAIADDLHKNQDIIRLRRYGAPANLQVSRGSCPTCHQPVADSLLSQTSDQHIMSVEDNIEYLTAQRRTFERMKESIGRGLKRKQRKVEALNNRSGELRAEMRSARQTLFSDGRVPSISAIRQRVVLQDRIEKYTRLYERFAATVLGFAALVERWKDLQTLKKQLTGENLTGDDKGKLIKLREILVRLEKQFGFDSFPPENLEISFQNYLPNREGFDLVYDVSASDNIRTIAAYLMALMELSRIFKTNHPGLLILDEPRQQSLSWGTFTKLFELGKTSKNASQQIIIATSEEESRVEYLSNDPDIHFLNFSGKVLQRRAK